jgi:hypothetical protein
VVAQLRLYGLRVKAPIITPELNANPKMNWGYFVYLLAKG